MSDTHQALQDLMLSYAAAVDERDRSRYSDLFTDDVEVVGFGGGTVHGREAWVDYVFDALQKYSASQHLLGPVYVDLQGEYADTRSDFQATHFLAGDEPGPVVLWATYHTRMRHNAGSWKICRHELVPRGSKHF